MRTTTRKLAYAFLVACATLGRLLAADPTAAPASHPKVYDLKVELQSGTNGPFRHATPLIRHFKGLSAEQVHARAAQARNRNEVLREKSEDKWFAALLSMNGPEPLSIERRFSAWNELADFIRTNKALVEVWADPGGDDLSKARRITAPEMAALQKEDKTQPALVTVTRRDPVTGQVRLSNVEFAFNAAARALTALREGETADLKSSLVEGLAEPILAALQLEGAGAAVRDATGSPQLEQAAQEGGVVEQVVAVESGLPVPADELNPQVHIGPKAIEETYTQVLGDLLEWRHYWQKKALGLPMDTSELLQTAGVLEDLGRKGIWIGDGDALVAVDAFKGSFVYRRFVQGQTQLVKVAAIPSRAGLVRDVAKAEAARRTEAKQRAALSPDGHGIALVHRVREVNGHPEVGSLVLSEDSAEGIDSLLALLDKLPATYRARLRFDDFSRTMVDADFDGRGNRDRFFLTIEFPPGKIIQRERINPLTGERELLVEEHGLLTKIITDARILEIDYNPDREETATRVYANAGSRQKPNKGSLLEETRTVEAWQRDLTQPDLDTHLPTIAKSRINHTTGETTREIYGLFPLPLATVDAQFITYRQFNPYGVLTSATVFENGRVEQDFERPLFVQLIDPIVGRERFHLSSTLPPAELDQLRDLKGQDYLTTVLRRDLVKGSTATQTFDNGHWGRKVSESYTDRLDGTNRLPVTVSLEYRNDFFSGQIPIKTTQRSAGGTLLSQTQTRSYDPILMRLVSVDVGPTGKTVTNVWDHRWPSPVEQHTAGRKTIYQFNHDDTQVSITTTVTSSGEEVSRSKGRFDISSQHWQVQRVVWFGPGVTNQSESLTLTDAGRVLSIRTADTFERRPVYRTDGIEEAAHVFRKNPVSGQFNLIHEQEDNYAWNAGERNARIQLYVDGQPYDSFRRLSDVEGRTLVDELREAPGLTLQTVITYDGWTERPLKAETFQNGQIRSSRQWLPEERRSDGAYLLPVKTVPRWGLTSTQTFRVGDPLRRPVSWRLDNLESIRVTQWYDATDIPKTFELRDPQGRPKERFSRRLNTGTEATLPCDVLEREKFGFWGAAALVERKALLRGTDVPLSSSTPGQKIYYDLAQPFEAPSYAVDPDGASGRLILVQGQRKEHVLEIFRGRLESRPGAEPILSVESIDLHQGVATQTARRSFDRAGHLLDERFATLPTLSSDSARDETFFAAFPHATATERFHYRYQPGWLIEQSDAPGGGKTLTFSTQRPESGKTSVAVNGGTHREFVTAIDGIKAAPGSLQPAALKSYFFRRIDAPCQWEQNPFLPGCSNVWTSWTATELAPDGEKLFDSELIYDAQGQLSVSKTSKSASRGEPRITLAYQLPEPDLRAWKQLRLASGTNSFALDLGGFNNLEGCEFLYFYLENTNRAAWSVLFKSASGQQVRVSQPGAGSKMADIATFPVTPFHRCAWPDRLPVEGEAWVGAPQLPVGRQAAVVVSVAALARAGLQIARVSSATLQIQGRAGDPVKLSGLARLVRESGPRANAKELPGKRWLLRR